ncbi:hypothetical protein D1012_12340 [Pseudotabrizicola alkalilacus]|uniref:Uncharacterized protein n=1 Tax=Pseudotabrizicola alkalilacus TaxID=2305252 RepID=A0A411Z1J5_9RHOB|nr:hypothetical protein D1012_12340 [Pseudotabrizicola alkalilacus]
MTFSRIAVTTAAVLVSVICLIFLADGVRVFFVHYNASKNAKAAQDAISACYEPQYEDPKAEKRRVGWCIDAATRK